MHQVQYLVLARDVLGATTTVLRGLLVDYLKYDLRASRVLVAVRLDVSLDG